MVYELAHIMFKVSSMFSLVSVEQGDVLAPGSPLDKGILGKGRLGLWS